MNGFVNLYKNKGVTSFQAVKSLSKILGKVKCGHIGTLDPMAEGVLPICLGEYTKLVDYLMVEKKSYFAELLFGIKTDSFDTTGEVLEENSTVIPSIDEINKLFCSLTGELRLTIPSFSSVKINGVRAYQLAREKLITDAGERDNFIYKIELIEYRYPKIIFYVEVSKGTYIRSLIDKIGTSLGTFAAMSGLVRSKNGNFSITNTYSIDKIKNMVDRCDYSFVESIDNIFSWPAALVKEDFVKHILNGLSIYKKNYSFIEESDASYYLIREPNGGVIATASRTDNEEIPLKLINVFKK